MGILVRGSFARANLDDAETEFAELVAAEQSHWRVSPSSGHEELGNGPD